MTFHSNKMMKPSIRKIYPHVKGGILSHSGDHSCKQSGRDFVYHYAWWWNWRALSSVIGKHLMVRNMESYLRFLKLNIANFVKYISIHNFLSSFCVEAKGVFLFNLRKIYLKFIYKQIDVSERLIKGSGTVRYIFVHCRFTKLICINL